MPSDDEPQIIGDFLVVPPFPKAEWTIDDFELLHRLGSGNYGAVFLASVRNCNMVVAIKRLEIAKLIEYDIIGQLRREIEIAFHCRHKYLLRTYTYFFDDKFVYLVMEPCSNGMLYSELNKVKKYAPPTAARYVAQLAEALMYL